MNLVTNFIVFVLINTAIMTNNSKNIYEWSVDDVACWLDENELSKHKTLLCDEHQIDGNSLISLTENDLRKPPVQMTVLGNIFFSLEFI